MNSVFDLRVAGLVLQQGRRPNALSWLLLALTGLWLLLDASVAAETLSWFCVGVLWLGVFAGLLQLYFAMRVDFDATLLQALASEPVDGTPSQASLEQLDRSLLSLGLIKPTQTGRDWLSRWRGVRRLLLRQFACLVVQAVCLAVVWVATVGTMG